MKKLLNKIVGLITIVISLISGYLAIKMLLSSYMPSKDTIIIIFVVCHFSALNYGIEFIKTARKL